MGAIQSPQYDRPSRMRGGCDAWEIRRTYDVATDDYFEAAPVVVVPPDPQPSTGRPCDSTGIGIGVGFL